MIYSIKGAVTHSQPVDTSYLIVVECGGIGYAVKTTHTTMSAIDITKPVQLFTYLNVREDAVELFGFKDTNELECFQMLLSVSGVGPKAALAILSALEPTAFITAVVSGDSKAIATAKGVGAKVSQRIVLELKDKISDGQISSAAAAPAAMPPHGNSEEAVSALTALGYSRSEAVSAVSGANGGDSVEDIIKYALKKLAMQG